MANITIPTEKLNKVLIDVEILIEDVSSLINQDEIAKKRLDDIKSQPENGVSEEDLDDYLEKREVEIE